MQFKTDLFNSRAPSRTADQVKVAVQDGYAVRVPEFEALDVEAAGLEQVQPVGYRALVREGARSRGFASTS